jgi:predicted  nucleic acid-binding Zn-ribbon protein
MGFLDKVKKGLGTAAEGAKIASSMAIIKKDLEHAKLKKSKALKQLGEVVYSNQEDFTTEIAYSELLEEISTLDSEIIKLEEELNEEGKKFNNDDNEIAEKVEKTVDEAKESVEDVKDETEEAVEAVQEKVEDVKKEIMD